MFSTNSSINLGKTKKKKLNNLLLFIYRCLHSYSIPKIFDIIRDYPTTKEAILDFHVVATKRDLLEDLQQKLKEE